jgi:hypothetical protein
LSSAIEKWIHQELHRPWCDSGPHAGFAPSFNLVIPSTNVARRISIERRLWRVSLRSPQYARDQSPQKLARSLFHLVPFHDLFCPPQTS